MAIGHVGEVAAHGAFEESAGGAAVGVLVGLLLGWPRVAHDPIGRGLSTMHWHSAWGSKPEFATMVELCVLGCGVLALVCAHGARALFAKRG